MPETLREWLDEDHPTLRVSDLVEAMGLSGIVGEYDERRGQPPYEPVAMVKILMYGYSRGVRSSRQIERACQDDVGFRYLASNQRPRFTTAAACRRHHREALDRLLEESVRLAR